MTSRHRSPHSILLAAAFLLAACPALALPPGMAIDEIHDGLQMPTTIRFAPDGRLFYTELDGQISYYLSPTSATAVSFDKLLASNAGERGLLGMAFHPDFPDSPFVYAYYSNANPLENRLIRYSEQNGIGSNVMVLMRLPASSQYHHGGRIAFGPDGMLYLSYGDQEDPASAQTITDREGKIFRLGRGAKPAPGNPWGPSNPAAVMGVRNVFGLCFDPVDGTGYFTDNGPECDDEINVLLLGTNYGWGDDDFCGGQPSGTRSGMRTWTPTIAPTGCCVYRGAAFPSHFDGNLFFGSFNESRIYRARLRSGQPDVLDTLEVFADLPEPVLDVQVGPDHAIWASTVTGIYRIQYTPILAVDDPGRAASLELGSVPNPFRDRVALSPHGAPAEARVDIYDLQGRKVRGWGPPLPARLEWDGRDQGGQAVPAGVYLARLTAGDAVRTRRLVRVGR